MHYCRERGVLEARYFPGYCIRSITLSKKSNGFSSDSRVLLSGRLPFHAI